MRRPGARYATVAACLLLAVPAAASAAQPPKPAGVTWGGKHFASKRAFAAWLSARGISYEGWSARHPHGTYLMTHAKPPRPAPARVQLPTPAPPREPGSSRTAVYVVLPLALLALLVGLLPLRRLGGLEHPLPAAVLARALEIRVAALACAAVLVVGLLLTQALA